MTNNPNFNFASSKYAQKLRDDKGGVRVDQNTRFGTLFAYYFADDYLLNSPYPNGGATIPASSFAYSAMTAGRAQLVNLGDTKNFGTTPSMNSGLALCETPSPLRTYRAVSGQNY